MKEKAFRFVVTKIGEVSVIVIKVLKVLEKIVIQSRLARDF